MGFPAKQKTWTNLANSTLTGATLALMMGAYLKGIADFLLAHGYTCKGSCDGTTGTMDGTNRWTTAALAGVRGTNTVAAQSWMVLTDGNGCNILLAFNGSGDSVAQINYSLSGVYVLAGTTTFQPTATDELILGANGTSVISTDANTTNRILFGWVDSTAKLCRFIVTLDGLGVGSQPGGAAWGVELFDSSLQQRMISPSVWGFFYAPASSQLTFQIGLSGVVNAFSQAVAGGRSRVNNQVLNINGGIDLFAGSQNTWQNVNTELQGASGFPIWGPLRVGSQTSNWTGPVGTLFDWWTCRAGGAGIAETGDTYNAKAFMCVGANGGVLWPWDGSTTPTPSSGYAIAAQAGTNAGSQNSDDPSFATLLESYSEYVPLEVSAVTPTGPTAAKTIARRGGVDVIRLRTLSADPPAETGKTLVYTRVIAGQQALFCRYPDGTVYQVGAG